jgi:hypothetical protein
MLAMAATGSEEEQKTPDGQPTRNARKLSQSETPNISAPCEKCAVVHKVALPNATEQIFFKGKGRVIISYQKPRQGAQRSTV